MTKAIVLRELLDAILSRKLLWITVLCCLPIPLCTLVNQRTLLQFGAYQARAEADYEKSLTGMLPADQIEVRAFRPKPVLAALAFGLESVLPNMVLLRRDGMSVGQGQSQENPVIILFGRIDLLFMVRFVLSLAAIVLTFGAICGEKELGTLSLIFSGPVPRDSVLLGKYLAASIILIVPFLFSLLLTVLLMQFQGSGVLASGEAWMRIVCIFLLCMLYLMAFMGLGILVSSLTSRPLVAITVLLFLWAGLVVVLPQSAGLLSERLLPVESHQSFLFKKNLLAQELDRKRAAELEPFLDDPNYESIRAPIAMKYSVELTKAAAEMDQEYSNRRRAQFRLASVLASVSPVTPLTLGVTAMAGTGVPQSDQFIAAIDRYQAEVNDKVFSQGYRDVFPGGRASVQVNLLALKEIPRFELSNLPLNVLLRKIAAPLGLLILANAVLFVCAYLRFLRYEVV